MTDRPLRHFTFRELLSHRAIAERAVRLGRHRTASRALIAAINAELEQRRERIFEKWSAGIERIHGGMLE
ncbi:MAG: hypothetical protein AAF224_02505 [Pseudomonadota bacterium]